LAVFYPYEAVGGGEAAAAGAALVLITVAVLVLRRKQPWMMVGWLWFLIMLLPVIGLMQVGAQSWADRYSYLPSVGFFAALVWMAGKAGKYVFIPALVAVAVVLSQQLSYWKNTQTLFGHAVAVTKNNYVALALLGSVADAQGKLKEADSYC